MERGKTTCLTEAHDPGLKTFRPPGTVLEYNLYLKDPFGLIVKTFRPLGTVREDNLCLKDPF
ncbi:hypothetical protein NC651_028047 [Populus alba x Populus x berolinensis]|nr:hypothetical protein NC651_028047 [Populus alba x Populus x berolinensis]